MAVVLLEDAVGAAGKVEFKTDAFILQRHDIAGLGDPQRLRGGGRRGRDHHKDETQPPVERGALGAFRVHWDACQLLFR